MVHTVRAALAVALLAGVYVLSAAIVAGFGFVTWRIFAAQPSIGLHFGFVITMAMLVPLGRALLSSLHGPPDEPIGLAVPPAAQPRLWDEVAAIAEQVGVAPPDEVRLVADVNAAVTERSRCLGLVGGARRLYLGVPLLIGLSRQQLQAVVAHELGHYSSRHTALAGVTYRGLETLRRLLAEFNDPLFGRAFRAYGRQYVRVSHRVNRRQELEADRFSASIAGRAAAIGAQREIGAITHVWGDFLDRYALVGVPHGMRPSGLFSGFAQVWTHADLRDEIDRLRAAPPDHERSVYDSHPSTADRIAALEALPDDGRADRSGPAVDLLDDPQRTLARVEDAMFAGGELDAVPWERMIPEVAAIEARASAATLARSAERAGVGEATLSTIVGELHAGRARVLVAQVLGGAADAEVADAVAVQLIGQTIVAALVDSGRASHRLDWSGPPGLVDGDGHRLDPWDAVERAVGSSAAVADLERWLAAHDVPAAYRVEPEPERSPLDDDPVVLGAVADLEGDGVRFLYVLNHGLVLRRPDLRDRLMRVLLVYGDHIGSTVRRALQRPVAELIADRRSTLVPWPDISVVELEVGSRWRLRMAVTTVDGRTRRLRGQFGYQVHGGAFDVMAHYLDDRLVRVEPTPGRRIIRGRLRHRDRAPTAPGPR